MRRKIIFLLIALSPLSLSSQNLQTAKKSVTLMGCGFEITAVATTDTLAWRAVEAGISEISRIEKLISSWDQNSQTSKINRMAGVEPVHVDRELYDLIYRSKKVSRITGGAFDISFASMEKIWKFDGTTQDFPDSLVVAEASSKIDWQKIVLDIKDTSVFLQEKGMRIGFGAIGKGYAANRAKKIMSEITGVKGGVVNASGDLLAWGVTNKSDYWKIQIADPKNKQKSLGSINLNDMAIVTSGDYEKYFISNGVRQAHIINPKTGYPATGIKSVTIICPDAELADALATSVFVLGKDQGLELVNSLNNIECLIVTDTDNILTSNNLELNYN